MLENQNYQLRFWYTQNWLFEDENGQPVLPRWLVREGFKETATFQGTWELYAVGIVAHCIPYHVWRFANSHGRHSSDLHALFDSMVLQKLNRGCPSEQVSFARKPEMILALHVAEQQNLLHLFL